MTDDIIKKYDGKRVKINGRLYVIRVTVDRRIVVSLDAMRDSEYGQWDVSTFMSIDDYPDADPVIKKAIIYAHNISEEIELGLNADFEARA